METRYVITISIKTPQGYMETGEFFIGNQLPEAIALFNQLQGHMDPALTPVLKMELCVKKGGDNLVLQRLSCTLQQLTDNIKLIVKEIFKIFNLV